MSATIRPCQQPLSHVSNQSEVAHVAASRSEHVLKSMQLHVSFDSMIYPIYCHYVLDIIHYFVSLVQYM